MEDEDGYMTIQTRWNTYQDAKSKPAQGSSKCRCCTVLLGVLLAASLLLNVALTALLIIENIGATRVTKEPFVRSVPTSRHPIATVPIPSVPTKRHPIATVPIPSVPTKGNPIATVPIPSVPTKRHPIATVPIPSVPTKGDPIATSAPDLQSSCLKPACSCDWIPGSPKAYVVLDPKTANPRIDLSSDGKTAAWGAARKSLPNNPERFEPRVWVLGREGFLSGKHCWEVEVKGDGEWAVGVAKQSVQRKGETDFSTKEGIWGIGEYWGHRNFIAFTSPHERLSLAKKPRRIRVMLDYEQELVEFFNAETKVTIFSFSSSSFGGEKIYPWLRVWDGTTLVMHP